VPIRSASTLQALQLHSRSALARLASIGALRALPLECLVFAALAPIPQ